MICCNAGEICCLFAAEMLQNAALHTAKPPPLRLQAVGALSGKKDPQAETMGIWGNYAQND